ncbi:YbgA family protein [Thiofilum flexile]|uniref:YbgA family protein n=1 Tax=Thiofilum flexile TaxID=125627 RepID=UPI000375BA8F|nr:DUF523 and DUF1722 domain-containing protein [Thiofilum flexile]
MQTPIKIGISSCLLGELVRYDGAHKRNAYIQATLGEYFEFVSFCPELSAGLGVPRPPIHLVRYEQGIRVQTTKGEVKDYTDAISQVIEQIKPQLPQLSGYILKKDSPSCGMERVKVYDADYLYQRPPEKTGIGLFAAALKQQYPHLPLEEEGRLGDPHLRENFIQRIYVYHRWQQLVAQGLKANDLVQFHSDHKYLIMAHNQDELRQLGRLVAQAGNHTNLHELCEQYIERLMQVLQQIATRGQQANTLSHIMGYLREHLDAEDKTELVEMIQRYQQGYVPLIVPITLLKHHFRRHPVPYIDRQYYLNPYPGELMLLNQV